MKKLIHAIHVLLTNMYIWVTRHYKLYMFLLNIKYGTLWFAIWDKDKIGVEKALYNYTLKGKKFTNMQSAVYEITSFKQGVQEKDYHLLEKKKNGIVYAPEFYRMDVQKKYSFREPEIFVAKLENVSIIGEESFVIKDKNILYDIAANSNLKRIDLCSNSIKAVRNNRMLLTYLDFNEEIDSGILLIGLASYNYYHITIEILSRLANIDRYEEYHSLPILIDEVVRNVPQYVELLKKVNIYQHPIIFINKNTKYQIKHLIYPSYNTWMPINVKNKILLPQDYAISENALLNIRHAVLPKYSIEPYRKIYISRKNMKNSRLLNAEETEGLFREYGFEIIYPEELSFEEQVKLFYESKYIASATGAALTNTVYCQENTFVVCIIPEKLKFYPFSTIAGILNLHSIYLDAETVEETKYVSMDSYKLNLQYARSFLNDMKELGDR